MAEQDVRVSLWLRAIASPYKWITIRADPEKRQLGDPVSYLPEVVVLDGMLFCRQKSGSYREAIVHFGQRVMFFDSPSTVYISGATSIGDNELIEDDAPKSWWRKLIGYLIDG